MRVTPNLWHYLRPKLRTDLKSIGFPHHDFSLFISVSTYPNRITTYANLIPAYLYISLFISTYFCQL